MPSQPANKVIVQWIENLIDKDSFLDVEEGNQDFVSQLETEVITGLGAVHKRPMAFYIHNTGLGGAPITAEGVAKIGRLMDKAAELRIPIVAFLASPGKPKEEGCQSMDDYTPIIRKNMALAGIIPQLAVIVAPTLGAIAFSAALMDFIFFNKHRSYLLVTSPEAMSQPDADDVTLSELGGAGVHGCLTGLADFIDDSTSAQIEQVKALLQFLPARSGEKPPVSRSVEPIQPLPDIPSNPKIPFNMLNLIAALVDNSVCIQYKRSYGMAMICAFSYIHGFPVGIVANQSTKFGGAIDSDASQKAVRFLNLCEAYGIPVITLIDVPGFMSGAREEQKGLLGHSAQFGSVLHSIRVPKVSVVIRKCHPSAAFLMMPAPSQAGHLTLALDSAGMDPQKSTDLVDEVISLKQLRTRLQQHLNHSTVHIYAPATF
jgi:acetyl-CoA carboxylase carboxyltransferase component